MATQSYRTNPTGVLKLDRSRITLNVTRNSDGKAEALAIDKIDFSEMGLPPNALVTAVAYSGFEEIRVELGSIASLRLPQSVKVTELDSANIVIRVFARAPTGHTLLATCEGIRPLNSRKTPLLPVEYKALGERMWELYVSGGSPPVLRINDNPDLALRSCFESHDPIVRGLVVPQAFEQALFYLILNPATDDDPEKWQNIWTEYLDTRDHEVPSRPEESGDFEDALNWAREVARSFSHEIKFVTHAIAKKTSSPHGKNN